MRHHNHLSLHQAKNTEEKHVLVLHILRLVSIHLKSRKNYRFFQLFYISTLIFEKKNLISLLMN